MARTQSFEVVAFSPVAPAQVFDLVADGAGWSGWAGPLVRASWWEREGTPAPGGVGAVRRLGTRQFSSREEIAAYEPPYHLGYTILSGQPVRDYRADVWLEEDGGTGTRIVWSASFRPVVPGTGRLMRAWLRWVVGGFARRLARAA